MSYLSLVTSQARLENWAVPYLSPTQPTLQLETKDFVEISELGLVAGLTPQCYSLILTHLKLVLTQLSHPWTENRKVDGLKDPI